MGELLVQPVVLQEDIPHLYDKRLPSQGHSASSMKRANNTDLSLQAAPEQAYTMGFDKGEPEHAKLPAPILQQPQNTSTNEIDSNTKRQQKPKTVQGTFEVQPAHKEQAVIPQPAQDFQVSSRDFLKPVSRQLANAHRLEVQPVQPPPARQRPDVCRIETQAPAPSASASQAIALRRRIKEMKATNYRPAARKLHEEAREARRVATDLKAVQPPRKKQKTSDTTTSKPNPHSYRY